MTIELQFSEAEITADLYKPTRKRRREIGWRLDVVGADQLASLGRQWDDLSSRYHDTSVVA